MKKHISLLTITLLFTYGCARVEVQAPKDPIKMDIAMRLDVYQHVAKDIDSIEDIVSGGSGSKKDLSGFFIATAYADDLGPEVEQAALRRRDRRSEISSLAAQGLIAQNAVGFIEAKSTQAPQALIQEENNDRRIIFEAIAKKNGTSVESVGKIQAEKHPL